MADGHAASGRTSAATYAQMMERSAAAGLTGGVPARSRHPSLLRSLSQGALDVTVRVTTRAAEKLGLGKKMAYSFLRMPLSSLDFTFRPARTAIWNDTLGQSLSSQASLISAVKSLDLLLGFTVGKASDNLREGAQNTPFFFLTHSHYTS